MAHRDDASTFADVLARLGDEGTKDLFRRLLEQALQDLIDVELTTRIGAGRHERSDARSNYRNGGRTRTLSTPAGDVELRIPKVRVGSSTSPGCHSGRPCPPRWGWATMSCWDGLPTSDSSGARASTAGCSCSPGTDGAWSR